MNREEFYVGYLPSAPVKIASVIRKTLFVLVILVCIVSLIVVKYQKQFSTATFEYGMLTTLDGHVFTEPVPHLSVPLGIAASGDSLFQNILLVGFGKSGADKVISNLQEKIPGLNIDGARVTLKGFLIYGDGRVLMQITEEDNNDAIPIGHFRKKQTPWTSLGQTTVRGEAVDPKCYFGVMKPGEGKSHRSCAIRCIAGGMPPVFNAADTSGYFLLVNESNTPINNDILPLVGDQIVLSGEAFLWDEWKILRLSTNRLQELSQQKEWREQLLAFEKGISRCENE